MSEAGKAETVVIEIKKEQLWTLGWALSHFLRVRQDEPYQTQIEELHEVVTQAMREVE